MLITQYSSRRFTMFLRPFLFTRQLISINNSPLKKRNSLEATSRSVDFPAFIFRYASLLYYSHFYLRRLSLGASPLFYTPRPNTLRGHPKYNIFSSVYPHAMQVLLCKLCFFFSWVEFFISFCSSEVFHFGTISATDS